MVGVHPAAVCSYNMLITAASSLLAYEGPPYPDKQGSDGVPGQVPV